MKTVQQIIIFSVIVFLMMGCSGIQTQKVEFIKKGISQHLILSENCVQKDGYLHLNKWSEIKSDQVIYGEEFEISLKLSISDTRGDIQITLADNTIGISNDFIRSKGKLIFIQGPSIGQTVTLGQASHYISDDKSFELKVIYKNDVLTYKIDGNEIFIQKPIMKPEGMLRINGYAENFRIYDFIVSGNFKSIEEFYNKEYTLGRAQRSVDEAAKRVINDPNRPAFHFQPPANWNNDPNGLLYYDGYYHMFYQHNPYSAEWNWMHWGHTRSKDLVHWEHLPIALWPSIEKGEMHCFSGSGFIMDDGNPILFYTSIGHKNPEHWAAVPEDKELINWKKHPQNPLIVMEDHGGQHIDSWRDPFFFRENGKTYMVIGGHPRDSKGSIMMYEALNPELTEWRYLGSPFTGGEKNWECPNFFKVEDKYVLLYSPHGHVEYYLGDLDIEDMKFATIMHGMIDHGGDHNYYAPNELANYYAPNTLQMDDGRRILFGWVAGFKREQGWQGAISLPRDLSLDQSGQLVQKPVPELTKLRGKNTNKSNIDIGKGPSKIEINKPQFELIVDLESVGAKNIGFRLNDDEGKPFEIKLNLENIILGDEKVALEPVIKDGIRKVQLFFDRTIIEIFVNDGLACATKVVYPDMNNFSFEIFSTDKNAVVKNLDIWEMKSIW